MATTSPAAGMLGRQLKQMQSDKDIPGISCGLMDNNVFEWEVMLMINDDCKYYGGRVIHETAVQQLKVTRWFLQGKIVLSHRISDVTAEDEI